MTKMVPYLRHGRDIRLLALPLAAALLLNGCCNTGGGQTVAVTTPVLTKVTMANVDQPIAPMPIMAPASRVVIATVAAPIGDLKVSSNGVDLERVVSSLPRERTLEEEGTGFFVVDDLDVQQTPPAWRVRIVPKPIQQCALEPFTLDIRHVVAGVESSPLQVAFAPSNKFNLVGTTGRIVALDIPSCTPIAEFKLERRSGGGPFTNIATLPDTGARYRDTPLTPLTPFEYRLTFVRVQPDASKKDVGSTPPLAASTTALMIGTERFSAIQDPNDPHHWHFHSFDPLPRGAVGLAVGAVITRVQNDGNGQIYVTFKDVNGAQVSGIPFSANSSLTAPFEGLLVAGDWDPIRTTGSAALLPAVWPMLISWREP